MELLVIAGLVLLALVILPRLLKLVAKLGLLFLILAAIAAALLYRSVS